MKSFPYLSHIDTTPRWTVLRGFMTPLWNLNFSVVSVEEIGNSDHQNSKYWNLM